MTRSCLSQYHVRIRRASDDSQLSRVSELRHVVGRDGLEPSTSAVRGLSAAPNPRLISGAGRGRSRCYVERVLAWRRESR